MGIDEDDKATRDSMLKEYSLQQKLALIKALVKGAHTCACQADAPQRRPRKTIRWTISRS